MTLILAEFIALQAREGKRERDRELNIVHFMFKVGLTSWTLASLLHTSLAMDDSFTLVITI